IGYLTNFVFVSTERPMALVVPAHGEMGILIPQLEQEHVKKAPEIADVQIYPEYPGERHPMLHLRELLERKGLLDRALGADSDGYSDVMGYAGPALTDLVNKVQLVKDIVDKLRQVKSPAELDL